MASSVELHTLLGESIKHLRKNCEGVFELEEFINNVDAFLKAYPVPRGDQ